MADLGIVIALATLAGGGLIAWGRLNQRVGQHDKDIEGKAEKEVVEVKFDAIVERLDKIDRGIERLVNGRN